MNLTAQSAQLIFMPERADGGVSATQGLEQIHGLGGPWECIESPRDGMNDSPSQHPHEVDDIPASLPETNHLRPREPDAREKDVYGIIHATGKAHGRWLILATEAICFGDDRKTAQAYRDWAREYELLPKLERQVLIHDIETSSVEVQERLSQNVILLLLNLDDHHSETTQIHLNSDREGLIARLVHSLHIPSLPKRLKNDEAQMTSLFRALLEMSGGRVDRQQHEFSEEFTTNKNAELLASVFEITTSRAFGNADVQEVIALTSQSPLFSQSRMSVGELIDRNMQIRHALLLGFEEKSLNLPLEVLEVEDFRRYLLHTYTTIESLRGPQNNQLVLLAWTATLFRRQTDAANRQLCILQEWANSEEGKSLYNDLARNVQGSQTVEQLVLTMVAMLGYSRLVPDNLDHSELPLKGSYLVDLDTQFRGGALGNRMRVTEHMVFAMIRVLSTFGNTYKELIAFLVAATDRQPPLLHALAALSDQYLSLRVGGADHESAFHLVMTDVSCLFSATNIERPHNNERHKTTVTQTNHTSQATKPTEGTASSYVATALASEPHRRLASPEISLDRYMLARLSNVCEKDVWSFFDTHGGTLTESPSITAIGDGTYEVVVLDSHHDALTTWLQALLPRAEFEYDYDPTQPTETDLELWGYDEAKHIRKQWFSLRAMRQIRKGWSTAAAYYAYRLDRLRGYHSSPNPDYNYVLDGPSILTPGN